MTGAAKTVRAVSAAWIKQVPDLLFSYLHLTFSADLRGKPVVVLSNNDGCVIARSAEAKRLGIKMGTPWFQLKEAQFPEKLYVFSSNYELYASLSNRVVALLEELSPRVEQYSIDECFLDARGIGHCMDLEDFGRQLRGHVLSGTGLTIGVGFGATKTLAKSAQWASKEWPQFRGVLALSPDNPRRTAKLLSLQPVEEIWGVGNRLVFIRIYYNLFHTYLHSRVSRPY